MKSKTPLLLRLWRGTLEFVSPYPMEECAVRLAACSQRRDWLEGQNRQFLRVIIHPVSEDGLRFVMDEEAFGGNLIEVYGYLTALGDGRTLVQATLFTRAFAPGLGWGVLAWRKRRAIRQLIQRVLLWEHIEPEDLMNRKRAV